MKPPMTISGKRTGLVLPCVLVVAALLVVVASVGASATSSSRRLILDLRARRMADLAARSACAEASSLLESAVIVPALTDPRGKRDLKEIVAWPAALTPAVTRSEFASLGVVVGDVSVETGPWRLEAGPAEGAVEYVRELGIVQLQVRVQVSLAGRKTSRTVTVRRYAKAVPDPGSTGSRLVVGQTDLVHEEAE